MRPTFDAALIQDLRLRVISHNEAHPHAKTKLGDLRKEYERGYRRSNPGLRAMVRIPTDPSRAFRRKPAGDSD